MPGAASQSTHKTPAAPEPRLTTGFNSGFGKETRQTFSKVFRYRLPDGQTSEPELVEVAGTFNQWQRVPLVRDGKLDSWHVTLHHIPGNKTHHYMLFLDGKPFQDKNCDGLAVPTGPQEEQYAIQTARGPRVMMLFAMTK